ncbi:hypothetical protein Dimus_016393 [Dionaea muscipula]
MALPPTPFQVGSFFVSQYYQILRESPELAHRFYTDMSVITRTDGDANDTTVTTLEDIDLLLSSLRYTGIEISKLKSQESWNGGILVFVSGLVKLQGFSGRRRFNETFFLAPQENPAPQEKGFFVLNDIFEFIDDDFYDHQLVTEIPEINVESDAHASPLLEQSVSSFSSEEETREYNSTLVEEDNLVDKYSIPDEQQPQEPEEDTFVGEAPVEEAPEIASVMPSVQEMPMPMAPVNEPAREPARITYASILLAKSSVPSSVPTVRQSMPPSSQPIARQSVPPYAEPYHRVQASSPQLNPSATSFVPDAVAAGTDNALFQEGERASVYVRNLPSHVTNADLENELKNFGRIKPNGVFIKNKKDVGVCFAFVEFEDMTGVQTAIQASPIQLLGRLIYIEQRRDGNNSAPRGGGVGRGINRGRGSRGRGSRSNYQNDTSRGRDGARNSGRGSLPDDDDDYSRVRGNGFHHRSPQ